MDMLLRAILTGLGCTTPAIRPIEITGVEKGDTRAILSAAFEFGQNDFQPRPGLRSVSVGDIIVIPAEYAEFGREQHHLVEAVGFSEVSDHRLEELRCH